MFRLGIEKGGHKSFSQSNQGGWYWDLNHDRIHPDHFLKGHEFDLPYLGARNMIFILFFSIKSYLALSLPLCI